MSMINATKTAYAASLVASDAPATLYKLTGYNSKGTAQFIQLHDAASLPADGAVPKIVFTVDTAANFEMNFGTLGRLFQTGIVVCNSSTGPTKTIGTTDCWFYVQLIKG
jgi:hypothetical protein